MGIAFYQGGKIEGKGGRSYRKGTNEAEKLKGKIEGKEGRLGEK